MSTPVSIVFATYNGKQTMPRMLERLRTIDRADHDLQIVAVDNASVDDTPAILDEWTRKLPGLVVLRHTERGKNRCLNAALPLLRGDLFIFTDDDVVPEEDWLQRLCEAARLHPDFDIFGGSIAPVWPRPPDPWILAQVPLGAVFGLTAADMPEGAVPPHAIWGANMMVRRRVFQAGLQFNADIGPSAGQYTQGSEVDFNIRAAAAGHRTWSVPSASVGHIIREHQLAYQWIVQRAFRVGKGDFVRNHDLSDKEPPALILPPWRWKRFLQVMIRAKTNGHTVDPSVRFGDEWEYNYLKGWIAAGWSARRRHP